MENPSSRSADHLPESQVEPPRGHPVESVSEVVRPPQDLPPAFGAMWRLCKLGYRHEPGWMVTSFVLSQLAALPDALLALGLMWLGQGVLDGRRDVVLAAAVGLAVLATGTWFLQTVSTRVQRRFRDKVTIALEAHVARLQATVATIAHQERPDLLDRLAMLRDQVFVLDHLYMSLFSTCGWILRLAVTIALLMSIHPALALLAACALPTVLVASWRPAVERTAHERVAQAIRLARHLFTLTTTAAPAKEIRVTGIGPQLVASRRDAWERAYAPVAAARWASAAWSTAAWALFGAGYVGAVVFVVVGIGAPAAQLLLVLAAGARLSGYIGATVGEIGFLRGFWMDGSRRLAWLEDYVAAHQVDADLPAPARITQGIRFENVSFAYPGTNRLALEGIDLTLPAGTVIALVGENGAGKSTLVKLLTKLYEPTAGRIVVDYTPLARVSAEAWRTRLAGAFQDFFRFELPARQTVGLGDLPRLDDHHAVATALERGGAAELVAQLGAGLDTQLGPSWPGGVELSFGQWQKLALARGFMRDRPLLRVLDEPTAALDAETEHALFERWAAVARRCVASGEPGSTSEPSDPHTITVLVSHRFSTVRMADLIVVLDGARVAEVGTHEELLSRGAHYAGLYRIQAAAYR